MMPTDGGHPRDLLSSYLDDELGVEDRSAIDRHLALCEDCRAELDGLRSLSRAVADERVPPPPADLLAKIGRSLDAASVKPARRFRYAVPATIAATLGAIGLLVALQWQDGRLVAPVPPTPTAVPEAKEERQAVDDEKARNAPAPSAAASGQVKRDRLEEPKRNDALKKKELAPPVQPTDAGGAGEPAKALKNEVASGFAPAPAAPIGGVAGARERDFAERVAPSASAVRLEARSRCEDHWSDSGVRGTWDVADVGEAASMLEAMARHDGGIGMGRGVADGQPFVLAVPRDKLERVLQALRARGVTGLDGPPAPGRGDDCAGISVELTVVAPPAATPPR